MQTEHSESTSDLVRKFVSKLSGGISAAVTGRLLSVAFWRVIGDQQVCAGSLISDKIRMGKDEIGNSRDYA